VPAQASIACGTLQFCTYEHVGYGGQMYYYTGPFSACIPIGQPWLGMISSVIDNKDIPVKLYFNEGCVPSSLDKICKDHTQYPDNRIYSVGGATPTPPRTLNDHVLSIWIGFTPP
jgi:hypothetical protein